MSFPLDEKLVIAVASSAIFDLREADQIFREKGADDYRNFTRDHESEPLPKGGGFQFIRRLLAVNDAKNHFEPIEVILLSKNDADTGLRVFNSLEHYGLPISRAAFTCGQKPYRYIDALNASLFLSANDLDVSEAIQQQKPAGLILGSDRSEAGNSDTEGELKIAFDFDGIIADDSAERIYKSDGLIGFQSHESNHSHEPLSPGPLHRLVKQISALQKWEWEKQRLDASYKPRLRTAMITARSAPAHRRVINTLRSWDIQVDEAFFLGGIEKARILSEFRPHIFFDDQMQHAQPASVLMASVHVPYGVANQAD